MSIEGRARLVAAMLCFALGFLAVRGSPIPEVVPVPEEVHVPRPRFVPAAGAEASGGSASNDCGGADAPARVLRAMDRVQTLVSEPMPWDHPDEGPTREAALREAAGGVPPAVGTLVDVRCDSRPCISIWSAASNLATVREHMEQVDPSAWVLTRADGPDGASWVGVIHRVEDVPADDPTTHTRIVDAMLDADPARAARSRRVLGR